MLGLERRLQEARLELAERERSITRLTAEVDRVRGGAADDARERSRADMERIVQAMGTPLVQLVTQAHLHQSGTDVRVDEVLNVAERLVRALEREGVALVGTPGEVTAFDPERHDALGGATGPLTGRQVTVRVAGLSCLGRVVRKAGVEATGESGGA